MREPAAPAGYAEERERGTSVVALPSVMETVLGAIRTAGSLHAAARASATHTFTGRGEAYRCRLGDADCVVRHFRRGGMVARLLDDEYVRVGEYRPIAELHASVTARARGVDSPEVVAAVVYPSGIFYRGDIATRYIAGARDLASVAIGNAREPQQARVAAWRAAGRLLHRAFDAGVEHADLNLRNMLIAGDRALLLDLDRAIIRDGPVSDATRRRMIARLHRSRRKLEALYGTAVGADELVAFAEGLRDA